MMTVQKNAYQGNSGDKRSTTNNLTVKHAPTVMQRYRTKLCESVEPTIPKPLNLVSNETQMSQLGIPTDMCNIVDFDVSHIVGSSNMAKT